MLRGDLILWGLKDLMTLDIFSNLNDPGILWKGKPGSCQCNSEGFLLGVLVNEIE